MTFKKLMFSRILKALTSFLQQNSADKSDEEDVYYDCYSEFDSDVYIHSTLTTNPAPDPDSMSNTTELEVSPCQQTSPHIGAQQSTSVTQSSCVEIPHTPNSEHTPQHSRIHPNSPYPRVNTDHNSIINQDLQHSMLYPISQNAMVNPYYQHSMVNPNGHHPIVYPNSQSAMHVVYPNPQCSVAYPTTLGSQRFVSPTQDISSPQNIVSPSNVMAGSQRFVSPTDVISSPKNIVSPSNVIAGFQRFVSPTQVISSPQNIVSPSDVMAGSQGFVSTSTTQPRFQCRPKIGSPCVTY